MAQLPDDRDAHRRRSRAGRGGAGVQRDRPRRSVGDQRLRRQPVAGALMRGVILLAAALASWIAGPAGAASRYLVRTGAGGGQPVGTQVVPPPDGFGHVPPFTVTRRPDGTYRHTFDVTTRRPSPTVTIYVGPGGDNSANCLSWATRCRSLRQAMVRAGAQPVTQVVRILAQAGIYRATSVDGAGIPTISGHGSGHGTWSSNPATRRSAAARQRRPLLAGGAGRVLARGRPARLHRDRRPARLRRQLHQPAARRAMWDEKYLNRFGRPLGLLPVPTDGIANTANPVAEINAAADRFGKGAFSSTPRPRSYGCGCPTVVRPMAMCISARRGGSCIWRSRPT